MWEDEPLTRDVTEVVPPMIPKLIRWGNHIQWSMKTTGQGGRED